MRYLFPLDSYFYRFGTPIKEKLVLAPFLTLGVELLPKNWRFTFFADVTWMFPVFTNSYAFASFDFSIGARYVFTKRK
jgi:hypothetical protein